MTGVEYVVTERVKEGKTLWGLATDYRAGEPFSSEAMRSAHLAFHAG
jgi:hypothetical protein